MDIQQTSCALVENCKRTSFWKCTALQHSSCHTYGSSQMAGRPRPQFKSASQGCVQSVLLSLFACNLMNCLVQEGRTEPSYLMAG